MYLKQIELQGFKSFQSKSIFKIDSNLIGIVGPNGSGKSNIIDAIRWVLGEQSAKNLRGSSMKDVIFSGTEEKKGKNFAEVTLTFNVNNEEKIITRRLYRNGDSEYLYNGKKSKLKEITDIYFDLGINKESYSIITQGKVESILSSKPQDRRIIIEEAAGVLKYKTKKKEAQTKLEKTNDNIKRLNDIFVEIEGRYEVLSEQKVLTEKYLTLTKELKEKDIISKMYDIKYYKSNLENANEDKAILCDERFKLDKLNADSEEIQKKYKNNILTNDKEFSSLKELELQKVKDREQIQSNLNILRERNTNKKDNLEKIDGEINELTVRELQIKNEINVLEDTLKNLKDKNKNLSQSYDNNTKIKIKDPIEFEKNIEKLKEEYFELISAEAKLQNELTYIKKISETTQQNIGSTNLEIESINKQIEIKSESLKAIRKSKTNYLEEKNVLTEKIAQLEKQKISNSENHANILEKISKGKELLQNFSNKKNFLETQNSSYETYNFGVKEILSNKNDIQGIHATVGDVISLDKDYVVALDTALANSQQSIIVDNAEVARKCVERLKNKRKGRATFLPLNSIVPKYLDDYLLKQLSREEGFINIADKLVNFDNKYKNVIANLLGLVVVVDNLKNGNIIAKKINYKYRIVTLDGQVINAGGSITGGSLYNNNNSILKNKVELEELMKNIEQIEIKLADLSEQLKDIEDKAIANNNLLEKSYKENNTLQLKISELDMLEDTETNNITNLKLNLESEIFKLNDYNKDFAKNEEESNIKKQLLNISENLILLKEKIEISNKEKLSITEENKHYQEQINNIKLEQSKIDSQIKYTKDNLIKLRADLEYVVDKLQKLDVEKNMLIKTDFSKINEVELEEKIKKIDEDLLKISNDLTILQEKKLELYKEEEEISSLIKSRVAEIDKLNSKIENTNLNIAKFEIKIDELMSYLINNYNISFEKAEEMFSDVSIQDIANYKNIVNDIKVKISQLGNINLNAIEEYEEVAERYNFYKTEINDLVLSKEKLTSTIFEIDKTVEERFLSTFEKIAANFDKIYRTLFNGGHAKITLENSKDLLNTGINIEASPPGKKLQKLSLLSGGEKALTAISLLFAILEIKNSPFVILDEVEAALDEVNVERFAQFLQHYSANNQFLVITHRRGTMEKMDKLYGVTMKEKGISFILPLDLNNIIREDFVNE